MQVLVVDIGGTNVKILAAGAETPRRFPSGRTLTPARMVDGVKELAGDWTYDAVAIGYPGRVRDNVVLTEPHNLANGWIGFDFTAAFECPVRVINDAAMQAVGSFSHGLLLFLGLGTGLGSALVANGTVIPLELAHLSFKNGSYEDYLGARALKRLGRKRWEKYVHFGATRMIEALQPDDVVLGGGNAKKLKQMPPGCRAGDNANAFIGGFRLWDAPVVPGPPAAAKAGRTTSRRARR